MSNENETDVPLSANAFNLYNDESDVSNLPAVISTSDKIITTTTTIGEGRVAPRPIAAAPRPKKKSATTTSSAAAVADTSVRSQTVVETLPAVAELVQSSQVQAMIASARQAELARIAARLPAVSHDWSDAPTLTVSSSTMAAARTYTLKTLNEAHSVNQLELLLDVAQQRDTRTQANIRKRERVDRANAKVGRMPKSSKTTVYQCSDCGRILKGTQHLRRHILEQHESRIPGLKGYICRYCESNGLGRLQFMTMKAFREHLRQHPKSRGRRRPSAPKRAPLIEYSKYEELNQEAWRKRHPQPTNTKRKRNEISTADSSNDSDYDNDDDDNDDTIVKSTQPTHKSTTQPSQHRQDQTQRADLSQSNNDDDDNIDNLIRSTKIIKVGDED